jgi:hypothetical protein
MPVRRFSLRTLLLMVTVFCIWLGYENHIVRTRLAVGTEASQRGFTFTTIPPDVLSDRPPAKLFFVRRWLGDEPVDVIGYNLPFWNSTREEAERLRRYFPEAQAVEEVFIHMQPPAPG